MAIEKIAIDFDSLYTNIYKTGSGMALSEPTVAAVGMGDKPEIKAVGIEARKLIGKTAGNTKIVFPVFEGEIVNEAVAAKLLEKFLDKVGVRSKLVTVHAVMSIPCGASAETLKKYEAVAKSAGVNKVFFVETPILSALGQRLPLSDSSPCFLIDMEGGTTSIAALSLDGIIAGVSINMGSNKISTDIIDHVAEEYGLQIGLLTAERLKKEIGSLDERDALASVVNGRDIKTGTPKSVSLRALDIYEPVRRYFDKIAELAMAVMVKLPPEVSAEIRHAGIYVSGSAAQVYGLEKYYSDKFKMQINVAENPDMVVALGGGTVVASAELIKKLAIQMD